MQEITSVLLGRGLTSGWKDTPSTLLNLDCLSTQNMVCLRVNPGEQAADLSTGNPYEGNRTGPGHHNLGITVLGDGGLLHGGH